MYKITDKWKLKTANVSPWEKGMIMITEVTNQSSSSTSIFKKNVFKKDLLVFFVCVTHNWKMPIQKQTDFYLQMVSYYIRKTDNAF